jgi:enamine deaminase RidA (YjgF/YER057c/UK114 family)
MSLHLLGEITMDRRKRIRTDRTPPSNGYRSKGMAAEGFIFTAGWIGVPMVAAGQRAEPAETLKEQTHLICEYLEQVTLAGGSTKEQVVEVSAFVADPANEPQVRQLVHDYLGFEPPLFNYHNVQGVARDAMLELDWIAVNDPDLSIEQAVEILGPFGHDQGMVKSGPLVMLNGLAASGNTLGEQTFNVMAEADRQLKEAGSSLRDLVKMNVFYVTPTYPGDYPQFNEATKKVFAEFEPPTRSVVRAPSITDPYLLRIDFLALGPQKSRQ